MSYMKHEYRPYPDGSEYAGTCKACARREQDHDLTPDELLVRTLKKGIENASPAALALNAEMAQVQTPVEPVDLGKAVIDAAIIIVDEFITPCIDDGIEDGRDVYLCAYCNVEVGQIHLDDCKWMALVAAVNAYEAGIRDARQGATREMELCACGEWYPCFNVGSSWHVPKPLAHYEEGTKWEAGK